jgi:hypothetical protein
MEYNKGVERPDSEHFVRSLVEEFRQLNEISKLSDETPRQPGETTSGWDERTSVPSAGGELLNEAARDGFIDFWHDDVPDSLKEEILARLENEGHTKLVTFLRLHHRT